VVRLFGIPMDTSDPGPWVFAAFVLMCGALAFEYYRRHFAERWSEIQIEIEDWIRTILMNALELTGVCKSFARRRSSAASISPSQRERHAIIGPMGPQVDPVQPDQRSL